MAYPQNLSINETNTKTILLDFVYPVGSIYMSVNNVSPASFLGGTWSALQDRFLIGASNSYAVNGTGGSTSHTHTTGNCTLTINQIPSHNHTFTAINRSYSGSSKGYSVSDVTAKSFEQSTSSVGDGQAHNHGDTGSSSNLPPYLAVYMWKRTA